MSWQPAFSSGRYSWQINGIVHENLHLHSACALSTGALHLSKKPGETLRIRLETVGDCIVIWGGYKDLHLKPDTEHVMIILAMETDDMMLITFEDFCPPLPKPLYGTTSSQRHASWMYEDAKMNCTGIFLPDPPQE